jgi:amino acid adenylation domain-containing protein
MTLAPVQHGSQPTRQKDAARAFWQQQLAGAPPAVELPFDRPRLAGRGDDRACITLELPASLLDRLAPLDAKDDGLFLTALAVFQVLLHRYTRQEDLLVGCRVEHAAIVLRTDLSGDPTFLELRQRSANMLHAARLHADGVDALPPMQVVFTDEPTPAECDLALEWTNNAGQPRARFHYRTDLFDAATIDRLAGHYRVLLEGIAADPDRPISALPLLTEAERRQLLQTWNPHADFPSDICLHSWFEAQVDRTPEAQALICDGRTLTYRELNQRANQLAHYLRKHEAAPDVLIGLYLERSLDLIVGLLGVLKAGAAYLPIDRAYPPDRAAFMLEDSQAPVLLTQASLAARASEQTAALARAADSVHVVCLDTDWDAIARESAANPANETTPDHLAYAIYTSGSTGNPKGVLVSHRNVARLFTATQPWYGFGADDVWTLFHSIAFDFSVWEIWGALLYGGRLVVIPYDVSRQPAQFYELLAGERVTVLNQTPSAFYQLIRVEEERGAKDLALRLVIFGGEALELQSLKPWFDRHGDERPQLVNMYGITETTVHVTYRPLRRQDLDEAPGSVIGTPIPDLQVYVLDRHQQPVPLGVPGEMYVGGAGLARGYLNRAELTAQRFPEAPFGDRPEARLYRSGDLARRLPGGDLQYLGRIDHQVKIRGFRIELGEIEAALARHPAVREAVVVARKEANGNHRLIGYVVPSQAAAPAVRDLRRFLKERLPEYMVPAALVVLDKLPLSPNGKVDRKALPAPGPERPELGQPLVAPRDDIERRLTRIWEEVLEIQPIGVRDDFFELGAHSLQAPRLFARIQDEFGKELPMALALQAPTIEQLAVVLRNGSAAPCRHESASGWTSLVPIQPKGTRPPFFIVHGGAGLVLGYYNIARCLDPDQPLYGLQALGVDGRPSPHATVEEMAAHYVAEVRSCQPTGPYYLGGYCFGGMVAYEMAQQLRRQGEQVALVACINAPAPRYDGLIDKTPTLSADLAAHRAALRTLRFPANLIYALRKGLGTARRQLQRAARGMARPISRYNQVLRYKCYLALGKQMPPVLRELYLMRQAARAERYYQPEPYAGRVAVFVGRGVYRDSHLGWDRLVSGRLEIYEVPGEHMYYQDIVTEPLVRDLADLLGNCLGR